MSALQTLACDPALTGAPHQLAAGSHSLSHWRCAQVRLLEHKQNKKIRLLMRQEKTLKIRANHIGELRGPA